MNQDLSALFDDELEGSAGLRIAGRILDEPQLLDAWHACSLIGAAMRGESLDLSGSAARFRQRLAAEPTVVSSAKLRRSQSPIPAVWAAAASVAGVAVVVAAALALQPARNFEVAGVEPMVRSLAASARNGSGAEEFMLAHQGVSPSGALSGFSHYARTVALASADASGRR